MHFSCPGKPEVRALQEAVDLPVGIRIIPETDQGIGEQLCQSEGGRSCSRMAVTECSRQMAVSDAMAGKFRQWLLLQPEQLGDIDEIFVQKRENDIGAIAADLQVNARIPGQKMIQEAREGVFLCVKGDIGQAQGSLRIAGENGCLGGNGVVFLQDMGEGGDTLFPHLRERQAVAAGAQQLAADSLLQRLDVPAQGRLRDKKTCGSHSEIAGYGKIQKLPHILQLHGDGPSKIRG